MSEDFTVNLTAIDRSRILAVLDFCAADSKLHSTQKVMEELLKRFTLTQQWPSAFTDSEKVNILFALGYIMTQLPQELRQEYLAIAKKFGVQ